jgi:lipoate-protein ligase A
VLSHEAQDGPWNMAVDDAVARAVGAGQVPPTLRFYAWSEPTVSLGCLQPARGVVAQAVCDQRKVAIVRRPTGGRAVLHDAELTYSVCVPLDGLWGRWSVGESFRRIGEALVAGLRRLGIVASLGPTGGSRGASHRGEACFQVPRMPAVLASGRKLVGSAQRRWSGVILQHGSLLLDVDLDTHQAVFPSWPRDEPGAGVTCLKSLLEAVPPRGDIERALLAGWTEVLGVRGVVGALTCPEQREAEHLATTRYGTTAWTWRC